MRQQLIICPRQQLTLDSSLSREDHHSVHTQIWRYSCGRSRKLHICPDIPPRLEKSFLSQDRVAGFKISTTTNETKIIVGSQGLEMGLFFYPMTSKQLCIAYMLWTSTNSFQFSNQVYKGQRKGVQNLTNVHTPMMEYEPAPSSGNVKIRTRRFMPRKVLNRAFLNQKRGSEGHLPLKLCLRGCVFLGILSKVGYVSRNWKKSTDRD